MSNAEVETASRSIQAVIDGPFLDDDDFHTLMGFKRDEARAIADSWPAVAMNEHSFSLLNNSLNNLIGYPHGRSDLVLSMSGTDEAGLAGLLDILRRRVIEKDLDRDWEYPLSREADGYFWSIM